MELNRKKILVEMEHFKWSQSELARRMGVHRQQISRLLTDENPSIGFIIVEKLADAFGIDPKELIK